jgi:hypothetical protein
MTEKERELAAALRECEQRIQRLEQRLRQLGVNPSMECGKCLRLQLTGLDDLHHIPECPIGRLEDRDAVIQELTALLTKAQWSLSGALKHELRLAFYHVERLTRPPNIMHSELIPWTHGMDLEDEITEHDTEVCEDLALDVRMLGELRQDRDDLLLQNQALRQRIRELEAKLLRLKD